MVKRRELKGENDVKGTVFAIIYVILGILIILAPSIISGRGYDEVNTLSSFLTADYIVRIISFIVGILIIVFAVRVFQKK